MNAVITTDTGIESFLELTENSLRTYASNIGAEFVKITEPYLNLRPHKSDYKYGRFEKLQSWYYFDRYDRILRLDSDILIHPECPDLFSMVPPDKVGVVFENQDCGLRHKRHNMFLQRNNQTQQAMGYIDGWSYDHFNSGVILASSCHADLWEPPEEEELQKIDNIYRLREQCHVNWRLQSLKFPVERLSYKYNHCGMFRNRGPRTQSYVAHYAGIKGFNRKKRLIAAHKKEWGIN